MGLNSTLRKRKRRNSKGPLWKGPQVDGVTQSLIQDYIVDLERFRISSIEGLGVNEGFSHVIEYGNMFHLCIENQSGDWLGKLAKYCNGLCNRFPTSQADINKWYQICRLHFPIYVDHYKRVDKSKKWIDHEKEFEINYELSSGRVVILRGKIDGVFNKGRQRWNAERKIRGTIDELKTTNQMSMDLQCMTYGVCMQELGLPVKGVLYDVVKRPLSSGKGCIKPHAERISKAKKTLGKVLKKAETPEEFYERLKVVIKENEEDFFQRWEVVFKKDVLEEFKRMFLNPVLENMCDDYEWWESCKLNSVDPFDYNERMLMFPEHVRRHYVFPFGVYHALAQGRPTEFDEYLRSGSTVGLRRKGTMFPELESSNA